MIKFDCTEKEKSIWRRRRRKKKPI